MLFFCSVPRWSYYLYDVFVPNDNRTSLALHLPLASKENAPYFRLVLNSHHPQRGDISSGGVERQEDDDDVEGNFVIFSIPSGKVEGGGLCVTRGGSARHLMENLGFFIHNIIFVILLANPRNNKTEGLTGEWQRRRW